MKTIIQQLIESTEEEMKYYYSVINNTYDYHQDDIALAAQMISEMDILVKKLKVSLPSEEERLRSAYISGYKDTEGISDKEWFNKTYILKNG